MHCYGNLQVVIASRLIKPLVPSKFRLTICVIYMFGSCLTPSSDMSFQISPTTSAKISLRALVRSIPLATFDPALYDQFKKHRNQQ